MKRPKIEPTRESVRQSLMRTGCPLPITEELIDLWVKRTEEAWRDYGKTLIGKQGS